MLTKNIKKGNKNEINTYGITLKNEHFRLHKQ